ncbi:MAG: alginate export family protein [Ignavibacterium sp.]|jgi:hypothetical protein|uniref:alginate export family protein n=1 Tax=Ignavibacterium sp. TaxID=2651167 RepID=UPI0032986D45
MKKLLLVILIFTSSNFLFSQELGGWKLNGQIQLRSEVDGRDFSNQTHPLTFTSMRTRLGVEKTFDEKVQLFVQFQDSRVFGEEPNTLAAIDNIDLHQGYVKIVKPLGLNLNVQAGRFEVAYGTERFFGPVGWNYIGRSFDGVRFTVAPEEWNLDLFALTVKESVGYIGNATPAIYPYPQQPTPSFSIYGFWKKNNLSDKSSLDLFGYFEVDRTDVMPDTNALEMFTLGGSYFGNYGKLSTVVEGAYQLGKRAGKDVSAYLISAQLNYLLNEVSLGAGADLVSGNDPNSPDKYKAFSTSYGTNHKFYGYMDYFINVAANTGGLGLNDIYVKAQYLPVDSKFDIAADFHHFMSNQKSASDQNTFGQEIDLTIKYKFVKGTAIVWGGSVFFPGDLMKALFAPREDAAFWTYLMITANL